MGNNFDSTEFIDGDLESNDSPKRKSGADPESPTHIPYDPRDPNNLREEAETYRQKISELQEQKERLEKRTLIIEESRRKQLEFRQGRQELMVKLTRGIEILGENQKLREQDLKTLAKNIDELKERLSIITELNSKDWPEDDFEEKLNESLQEIENSRMEWNRQLVKYPKILKSAISGPEEVIMPEAVDGTPLERLPLNSHNLQYLCKLGFALTWPIAVSIIIVSIFIILLN